MGLLRAITSVLSAQGGYSDNGATYPVTMCPQQVGRDASYATSTRTNTLNGLDNTKLYDIQLYASRGNAGQTTRFTVNGTNVDIATNSNFTNIATFSNIAPSAGKIVITIANVATYNYLNGFTLTEKPGAGGTNQSPVASAGIESDDHVAGDYGDADGKWNRCGWDDCELCLDPDGWDGCDHYESIIRDYYDHRSNDDGYTYIYIDRYG